MLKGNTLETHEQWEERQGGRYWRFPEAATNVFVRACKHENETTTWRWCLASGGPKEPRSAQAFVVEIRRRLHNISKERPGEKMFSSFGASIRNVGISRFPKKMKNKIVLRQQFERTRVLNHPRRMHEPGPVCWHTDKQTNRNCT